MWEREEGGENFWGGNFLGALNGTDGKMGAWGGRGWKERFS